MSVWYVDYLTIEGFNREHHTTFTAATESEHNHRIRNRPAIAYEVTGFEYHEEQP